MKTHRLVVLVAVAACTRAPTPAQPARISAAPLAPAELDDAAVVAKTLAFFAAFDGLDLAGFEAAVGPAFVLFEQQRFYDAAFLSKGIQARRERKVPPRTRTCSDERIRRGGGVLIFIGRCIEKLPNPEGGFNDWEGWSTVVWAPEAGTWKAAHWQWQRAGLEAERDRWNATYQKAVGYKRTPNQLLIDTIKGRKPGTALDVAMGQGRNAVYLASQGWKVTGVDISNEGIRIAKQAAAERTLALETVEMDVKKYDFGKNRWDLVTLIYAGNSHDEIETIKTSVKPGGLFVVEFFHRDSTAGTGVGGFAAGELAALFKHGWTIKRDEVVEDVADWGLRKTKLVRFVAEKQ